MADPLLADVLAASIDGLCVFDRDRNCLHWNAAMERLTGVGVADAVGKGRDELFPDAQTRTFAITFHPTSDGGVIGVARKSEAGITEMLSLASHKLKTPLTALQIHLGAQLRQVQRGQSDRTVLERGISSAIEQAMRLADTINMLVDVSRIDSGRWQLDPTEFELGELVRHTVKRLEHTASDNGCEMRCEVTGALHGTWDRVRIEEVLATLLNNAFKHGVGKPVELTVRGEGTGVQLTLVDHGPGMTPDELSRVFDRGPRTALGLWIAKEIVSAHKGTIEAKSGPGGSTFVITLPRAVA